MNAVVPLPLHPDRRTYLGGSDIAAVLGVSKWSTPLRVWQQKTGRHVEEVDEEREKRLARGKRLEPTILQMVGEAGIEVIAANVRPKHPEHGFLACEIDFLWTVSKRAVELVPSLAGLPIGSVQNGEIKTVHPFAAGEWGEEGSDDVPTYYAAQSMYGLGVSGRQACLYATLVGMDDLLWYVVRRDEQTIDEIIRRAVQFWTEHVIADVPPDPIDFNDLRELYAKDDGGTATATPELEAMLGELRRVQQSIKTLSERADQIKFEAQAFMQPAAVLLGSNGKPIATWKSQTSSRLDQKRLAAEMPEIVNQYRAESSSRVFRLKKGTTE